MESPALILGLFFVCVEFTERAAAQGFVEAGVRSECRDRYLWIQVASAQTPHFEAVDGDGVHSISEQLAARCGYTISNFKMDGFTTFRASYYSCFTHNQNDEVFTFRLNVVTSDGAGGWIRRPVSEACSGLIWTHREVVCEENYMEVNVNTESSCGGQRAESGPWQEAFSQAQRKATSAWQLMFLQTDRGASTMTLNEARTQGYSLSTSAHRAVLRAGYNQQHAELLMVEGLPMEVLRVSLFLKRKMMVEMRDVSMACTVNSGSFDGAWLLWDVPLLVTPLVDESARFESQSLGVGVEAVMLDEPTASHRGFRVTRLGGLVQIRVPYGAEGGYRKSSVVDNVYKELYVIFMFYEHVFSLMYEDGSGISTRHRMLRVLDTPLLCRPAFSLDQTVSEDQVFSVYLGNIPSDVMLEEVLINRKQLMMSQFITPLVHANGSRAYELRLPFEDGAVQWKYLGGGVVQYSVDVNFTLTIMPQRDSYYHHTSITARLFNAFPPEITAQCSEGGISFSVVHARSLWEVGVDEEALTSELVEQRGYLLHNDTHRISLQIPVFSVGYSYQDINLSNFYGTFKLLLRDSKTLEVQTSTSKRCLFKTREMIVCSEDGTMTVVTSPSATWPLVPPDRMSLLDRTCGPKQVDASLVLFQFDVNSCGTRAMVGESYMVYENEIIHDRQLIADGPNLISRESQFKLTVRCFYPLSGVNRLSLDQTFRAKAPGVGSIKVFKSLKGSATGVQPHNCLHQVPENVNTPMDQIPAAEGVPPESVAAHNKLVFATQDLQTLPNHNILPNHQTVQAHQVPQQVSFHPGGQTSHAQEQNILNPFSSVSRFDLSAERIHPASFKAGGETSGPIKDLPAGDSGLNQTLSLFDSQRHPVLPQVAPYSSDQISRSTTSQERTGNIGRRNIQALESGVQNIRVKPLSRFVSSGHGLKPKPTVKQTNFDSTLQSGNDEKLRPSQPTQGCGGSNTGPEHLAEKTEKPTLEQRVQVKPLQSAVTSSSDESTNQLGQQNLIQEVDQEPESASALKKVFQLRGVSHVRVRPGPGSSRTLQTQDWSRLQNLRSIDSGSRPTMTQDLDPTAGGPGSDCSSPYGSSLHQGIIRGRRVS